MDVNPSPDYADGWPDRLRARIAARGFGSVRELAVGTAGLSLRKAEGEDVRDRSVAGAARAAPRTGPEFRAVWRS